MTDERGTFICSCEGPEHIDGCLFSPKWDKLAADLLAPDEDMDNDECEIDPKIQEKVNSIDNIVKDEIHKRFEAYGVLLRLVYHYKNSVMAMHITGQHRQDFENCHQGLCAHLRRDIQEAETLIALNGNGGNNG